MKLAIRLALSGMLVVLLAMASSLAATAQEADSQEPPPPPADPMAEQQTAAVEILQTADPEERIELIEAFLANYPDSPFADRIYLAAVEAYRMQADFPQAIEYGERALKSNPDNVIALVMVADSYSEGTQQGQADFKENLTKAEGYSGRALELMPAYFAQVERRPDIPAQNYDTWEDYVEAQAHATLGYVHLRREEYGNAETELLKATELNQLQPSAADFERLGIAQVALAKLPEAEASFQRCLEVSNQEFQTCQLRLEDVQRRQQNQALPPPPQE